MRKSNSFYVFIVTLGGLIITDTINNRRTTTDLCDFLNSCLWRIHFITISGKINVGVPTWRLGVCVGGCEWYMGKTHLKTLSLGIGLEMQSCVIRLSCICFYYTWCTVWLLTLHSENSSVLGDVFRSFLFSGWSILFSKWLIGHQSLSEEVRRNPEVSWCSS